QQRLEPNHAPARQIDHRLEISLYLPGFDGDTQIPLNALFALPGMMKTLLEKIIFVAAAFFGSIKRKISSQQHFNRIETVQPTDADAGTDFDREDALIMGGQTADNACGYQSRLDFRRWLGINKHKLIAANTRQNRLLR